MAQGIIMFAPSLTLRLVACTLAALAIESATAAPVLSWNLSRDMHVAATSGPTAPNPVGDWTFMSWTPPGAPVAMDPGALDPLPSCKALPGFGTAMCWTLNSASYPLVWTNDTTHQHAGALWTEWIPKLHPHPGSAALIRWKAPLSARISILGRFSSIDKNGNGVAWSVVHNGNFGTPIAAGTANWVSGANDGDSFRPQPFNVVAGDTVDFIVDANGSNGNDTTELDVLITAELKGKK